MTDIQLEPFCTPTIFTNYILTYKRIVPTAIKFYANQADKHDYKVERETLGH